MVIYLLYEEVKYYEENKNPNILIEANNTGILSDSDLVELLGDFDKIFDLKNSFIFSILSLF